MEKLEGLWMNDETLTSDSKQLDYFKLNQIILIKQMNELVRVLDKLRKFNEII